MLGVLALYKGINPPTSGIVDRTTEEIHNCIIIPSYHRAIVDLIVFKVDFDPQFIFGLISTVSYDPYKTQLLLSTLPGSQCRSYIHRCMTWLSLFFWWLRSFFGLTSTTCADLTCASLILTKSGK